MMKAVQKIFFATVVSSILLGATSNVVAGCGCGKPKPPVRPLVREIQASLKALEKMLMAEKEKEKASCPCVSENAAETRCIDMCANAVEREAKRERKCCKQIKEQINDITDLVEDQTTATQNCCDTINTVQTLVTTQTDNIAACCDVTSTLLGELDETCSVIPASAVDTSEFSVIKWLKSIYCLINQINTCLDC